VGSACAGTFRGRSTSAPDESLAMLGEQVTVNCAISPGARVPPLGKIQKGNSAAVPFSVRVCCPVGLGLRFRLGLGLG